MSKTISKARTTIAALGAAALMSSGCVIQGPPQPVTVVRPVAPGVVVVQQSYVEPAPVVVFPFDIFLRFGGHGGGPRDWRR